MEMFPVCEIARSQGIEQVIYNRGVSGLNTDEFLENIDTYAMTFLQQKRAITYLCSCKRFVLFYRHDLSCLIMILPYSHSLSVQSVARNGYGYIRTMQRWNSCGL